MGTLSDVDVDELEQLATGMYHLERLPGHLQSYLGPRDVLLTSSGTSSLHTALAVSELKPGDEVIVPAMSPPCVIMPIKAVGGVLVVCDVDESLNPSVDNILEKVTPRTRVLLAVHRFGHVAPVACYRDALPSRVMIVEDCAQTFGGKQDGEPVGTSGDLAIYSFGASKIVSAGGGGALTCRDADLTERARRFISLGTGRSGNYVSVGLNYEMPNVVAWLILQRLRGIDCRLRKRRDRADNLSRCLLNAPLRRLWTPKPTSLPSLHRLIMKVDPGRDLKATIATMRRHGAHCETMRERTLFTEPLAVNSTAALDTLAAHDHERQTFAGTLVKSLLTIRLDMPLSGLNLKSMIKDLNSI